MDNISTELLQMGFSTDGSDGGMVLDNIEIDVNEGSGIIHGRKLTTVFIYSSAHWVSEGEVLALNHGGETIITLMK